MPIDLKRFSGFLNSDDSNFVVGAAQHLMAFNGKFRGVGESMRFENIPGNTLIPNANLPNTGTNECIGAYEDVQKARIFYFVWNSGGKNCIFVYDINAQTITPVIIALTDSATDILNFDLNQPIVSVNIIYGDAQQGDILYWIDSLKRTTKINITRALDGGYGAYIRSYLDVAKEIPSIPPACAYEDDSSVTVNNLRGNLFKGKTRYYFDDNDKSATSSQSVLPLPVNEQNPALASDATKNAVIKFIIPTGAPNVKKLELLVCTSLGNTYSDYFSVITLVKADLGIPDNDTYIYKFYNDQQYAFIDVAESTQLFDYVPITANGQEVLMTNILIYSAITENYNPVVPDISELTSYADYTNTRMGMIVTQSGDTGFGTGNIHISIVGQPLVFNPETNSNNVTVNITMADATNITYNHSYTTAITLADIIAGLISSATGLGFAIVSSDINNIIVNKTDAVLSLYNITNSGIPETDTVMDSTPAYDFSNGELIVPVYFDEKGKTIGAVVGNAVTIQTLPYTNISSVIPYLNIQINSQPPLEATYFHLTRLSRITKSFLLEWVTDRAYSAIDPITNTNYAYLSIENMNQYTTNNPATKTQLTYSFTPNDRVKIMINMVSGVLYTTFNDYQIQDSIENPIINGVQQQGQFLKILLPVSPSSIVIDGTKANFNFLIEMYTPSKTVSQNANLFNEFGERYLVINPGASNRYHQGKSQNQTVSQPAIYNLTAGDVYVRQRNINAGNQLTFNITVGTQMDISTVEPDGYVLGETFTATFTTPEYVPQIAAQAAFINSFADTNYWIQVLQAGVSFDIKGQVVLEAINATADTVNLELVEVSSGTTIITTLFTQVGVAAGEVLTIPVNLTYTVTNSPSHVYIVFKKDQFFSPTFSVKPIGGSLSFIETGSFYPNIKIIDQNFSDFYPSQVNANGRTWAIQPNIKQTFTGTLVRYGLPYEIDTTLNNANRFYPQNFDQYDAAGGDIQRLKVRGTNMRVFQENKCGLVPVFQNVLNNTDGTSNVGQSSKVINSIQYYEGEYGMGKQYTGLVSGKIQDYFVDPIRGEMLRLSNDGIIPISKLYKGQFYIKSLLTPFNDTYLRTDGAIARIFGYYDYLEEQAVFILNGGTNTKGTINPYTFSFNEIRNAYCSFYNLYPEFALCAEEVTYSWLNGNLYIHNNTTNYTNFFGVQYQPSITLAFNDKIAVKKSFLALAYQASDYWIAKNVGDIISSQPNIQTGMQQISQLIQQDFEINEALFYAAFLRDANSLANSQEALVNGDFLKGVWVQTMVTYMGSDFAWLLLPYINYSISPRNM